MHKRLVRGVEERREGRGRVDVKCVEGRKDGRVEMREEGQLCRKREGGGGRIMGGG